MLTKEEARKDLKRFLGEGSTVYATTLSQTDSGCRSSFYVVHEGYIQKLDFWLESAGFGRSRRGSKGLSLRGSQMDLEHYLVRWVSEELYDSPDSLHFARL